MAFSGDGLPNVPARYTGVILLGSGGIIPLAPINSEPDQLPSKWILVFPAGA